jgi:hypothetical protein
MAFSKAQRASPDIDFNMSAENQVETLVGEIGRVIRAAEPREQPELKELAETLLHEEISAIDEPAESIKADRARRPFNPLAAGILLMILGIGIALVVAPVGLSVVVVGLFFGAWGAILSWMKK